MSLNFTQCCSDQRTPWKLQWLRASDKLSPLNAHFTQMYNHTVWVSGQMWLRFLCQMQWHSNPITVGWSDAARQWRIYTPFNRQHRNRCFTTLTRLKTILISQHWSYRTFVTVLSTLTWPQLTVRESRYSFCSIPAYMTAKHKLILPTGLLWMVQ